MKNNEEKLTGYDVIKHLEIIDDYLTNKNNINQKDISNSLTAVLDVEQTIYKNELLINDKLNKDIKQDIRNYLILELKGIISNDNTMISLLSVYEKNKEINESWKHFQEELNSLNLENGYYMVNHNDGKVQFEPITNNFVSLIITNIIRIIEKAYIKNDVKIEDDINKINFKN